MPLQPTGRRAQGCASPPGPGLSGGRSPAARFVVTFGAAITA
jgi:hypothetical protein